MLQLLLINYVLYTHLPPEFDASLGVVGNLAAMEAYMVSMVTHYHDGSGTKTLQEWVDTIVQDISIIFIRCWARFKEVNS
jgi:hypothetical protein